MRAFSQLLDDLVYTRSRNTKLKLIGDYLKETPIPTVAMVSLRSPRRSTSRTSSRPPSAALSRSGSTRSCST